MSPHQGVNTAGLAAKHSDTDPCRNPGRTVQVTAVKEAGLWPNPAPAPRTPSELSVLYQDSYAAFIGWTSVLFNVSGVSFSLDIIGMFFLHPSPVLLLPTWLVSIHTACGQESRGQLKLALPLESCPVFSEGLGGEEGQTQVCFKYEWRE